MTNKLPAIIAESGITHDRYRVLKEAVFPGASDEGIALALAYCKERGLDVLKKHVHIVKVWNNSLGKEVEGIWPGIAEARSTASRTGAYAGSSEPEYGEEIIMDFPVYDQKTKQKSVKTVAFPKWCKVTVYKLLGSIKCEYTSKVFWLEEAKKNRSGAPNSMWADRPYGQIAKVAEASALRKGFPEELGGEITKEEAEGISSPHPQMTDITPPTEAPTQFSSKKITEILKAEADTPAEPLYEFFDGDGTTVIKRPLRSGCEMIYRSLKDLPREDRSALYYLNRTNLLIFAGRNSKFKASLDALITGDE